LDYLLVKHRFINSVRAVQTVPGADVDSNFNLVVAKIRIKLKKIIRFQKKTTMGFGELYTQRQRVRDTLEEKIGEMGCNSGDVEVQWNNIENVC